MKTLFIFTIMKTLFIFAISIFLISCSGLDAYQVKMSVMQKFPHALMIYTPPGKSITDFIVIDKDSTIYYVKNRGLFVADKNEIDIIYKFKR